MTLDEFLTRLSSVSDDRDGWVAICPAHADSHPSLRITVSDAGKVLLKCRAGCETARKRAQDPPGVLDVLRMTFADLDALDIGDAPSRVASQTAAPNAAAVAALAAQLDNWAASLRTDPAVHTVSAYAQERFGLSADDETRLGLGAAERAVYDDGALVRGLPGGPRLVVPFRDRSGVPQGYQARALDRDARVRWLGPPNPDGAQWSMVGWLPGTAGWAEVIVTEGPGDGLTACATGYDVIVVRGASLAAAVADDIARMVPGRPVVICGDADSAGDKFSRVLAAELAKRGVSARKLRPPVDGDDLTDWRRRDPEAFATAFIRAVSRTSDPGGLRTRVDAWTDEDLTDVAFARRLREHVESIGSGVRYSPQAGFYRLADGVWRADELDLIRTDAQDVAGSMWLEVCALADAISDLDETEDAKALAALTKRVGTLRRRAVYFNSRQGIDAVLRELQALRGVAVDVNDFDRYHHLIACRNGVINLRTGALMPPDSELLITRRVNLDYDPSAQCPRWEAFLNEVFPAYPDLPTYMRRLVGYGVTGETSEQCFAVLWGTGANGKSVFTDTLTAVFREVTTTTAFATFEERPSGGIPNDIAALKGARLVMAAEGEQGKPMAEAILKRVTGRDPISARFMRREFFEFYPTFLLMLATNFKPAFRGQDEGLWRRVKLIPWERYFASHERDPQLGAKLLAEAPGILAWAVRGAVEWYRSGLQDPPTIVDATSEYRRTSDALAGFIPNTWILDSAHVERVSGNDLFASYLEWADEENLPAKERWTRRAFFAALDERGATRRATNKGVAFEGIRRSLPTDLGNMADGCTPTPAPAALTVASSPSLADVI